MGVRGYHNVIEDSEDQHSLELVGGDQIEQSRARSRFSNQRWLPWFVLLFVLLLSTSGLAGWIISFSRTDERYRVVEEEHNSKLIPINASYSSVMSQKSTVMPAIPRIHVIHVGKAGGMSVIKSLQLPRKNAEVKCRINTTHDGQDEDDCYKALQNDSQLEFSILGYFHMYGMDFTKDEGKWLMEHTNTFLFTARDPIDRLISTYNYHRQYFINATARKMPRYKVFYRKCFPGGLNAMIDKLKSNAREDDYCTKLGVRVLEGHRWDGGWHFQLNYKYYKENTIDTWPHHAVAVIRTEKMWDDIAHLDEMLGGTGKFEAAGYKHYTHGSEKYDVQYSASLSRSNAIILCCLIWKEMETYQLLILRAFNLNDGQKHEALSNLLNHCQMDVSDDRDLLLQQFDWEAFGDGSICADITQVERRTPLHPFQLFWQQLLGIN